MIYFVSYEHLPDGAKDDRLLLPYLRASGIDAQFVVWDDPNVDWSKANLAIIRSAWDYFIKFAEFSRWLDTVSSQTCLINPVDIIRWNLHKGYQQELAQKSIPCVETIWVKQHSSVNIAHIVRQAGWQRFIIKPTVSAASYATCRFTVDELDKAQLHLNRYSTHGDMMIQPYLESFDSDGETSLVFFEGEFSHAVQRQAALNATDPFSAENKLVQVPDSVVNFSQNILNQIDDELVYARVDVSIDANHQHTLLELELVEPSLFLDYHPDAAKRFTSAIVNRLR